MPAPRGLGKIRNTINKGLRRALEEIQEALGRLEKMPARVPVPVRSRQGCCLWERTARCLLEVSVYGLRMLTRAWAVVVSRTCVGAHVDREHVYGRSVGSAPRGMRVLMLGPTLGIRVSVGGLTTPRVARPGPCFAPALYTSTRFYHGFQRHHAGGGWRWARLDRLVMFQNFLAKSQFRLRQFHAFFRGPTLTELLRLHAHSEREAARAPRCTPLLLAVKTPLRLHQLLTLAFYDMVIRLARPVQSGCYVEFRMEPPMAIPEATMLSPEVLAELLADLRRYERHLVAMQQDLARLSELGELPLKYVRAEGVIRVYFPNCDRERLQTLLMEKQVSGGVIRDAAVPADALPLASLNVSSDVLSSTSGLYSSSLEYLATALDILSSDLGLDAEMDLMHVEPVTGLSYVEIQDYEWA